MNTHFRLLHLFKSLQSVLFGSSLGTGAVVTLTVVHYTVTGADVTFTGYNYAYFVVGGAMMVCFLISCCLRFGVSVVFVIPSITKYNDKAGVDLFP